MWVENNGSYLACCILDIDGGKGSTFINHICEILEKCDKGDVHGMIKQLIKAEVL